MENKKQILSTLLLIISSCFAFATLFELLASQPHIAVLDALIALFSYLYRKEKND